MRTKSMVAAATTMIVFALFLLMGSSITIASGCTPEGKQVARTAIDVALAACIAEHSEIENEPALREVCKWADEAAPVVKDLLLSRKKGLAKARRLGCPSEADGGR